MQNRCVSEEVLSICLANHSFINEIREISFPLKNSHKIYIRYNTKSLLYIIILTDFKSRQKHTRGMCVDSEFHWTINEHFM